MIHPTSPGIFVTKVKRNPGYLIFLTGEKPYIRVEKIPVHTHAFYPLLIAERLMISFVLGGFLIGLIGCLLVLAQDKSAYCEPHPAIVEPEEVCPFQSA